ncbi:hypothetical protein [Streptomyces californicus]|uniref:hypothetical protein n=1 Tax=Streptomyces californicus TaxID=67351 RepID=UPI00296F421E|nr:hypothetical protein [Streptomyces californicus]MDW4913746.1 hypothetical protein [Streptomyces californicus]
MLILGVALLAFGLVADARGWWEGHEFATNVASSVTSLCFGVPAALLVFSHLGQAQEGAREKVQARAQVVQAAAEFEAVLLAPFTVADLAQLQTSLQELSQALRATKEPDLDIDETNQRAEVFFNKLHVLLPSVELARPYNGLRTMQRDRGQWEVMRKWQTQVQSQSRILDEEVRPRVLASGLTWLAPGQASDIIQAARWLFMEGRNPWKPQSQDRQGRSSPAAVSYFLADVTQLCAGATALKSLSQ